MDIPIFDCYGKIKNHDFRARPGSSPGSRRGRTGQVGGRGESGEDLSMEGTALPQRQLLSTGSTHFAPILTGPMDKKASKAKSMSKTPPSKKK